MPIFILFLFSFFLIAATQIEDIERDKEQENTTASQRARTEGLARLVNAYIDEHAGIPPGDLSALAGTPGYHQANEYLDVGTPGPYLATLPINDGINDYYRVIVYNPPVDGSISAADYLLAVNNNCGGTEINDPSPWCGNPKGNYWIKDTLSGSYSELNRERTQQQQTLKKFAPVYNVDGKFPDPGTGNYGQALLTNQLVGYSLTAATCTGVWEWKGIPLTCDDLYDVWRKPRVYNYLTSDWISLYAESPWKETTGPDQGKSIIIASQLDAR